MRMTEGRSVADSIPAVLQDGQATERPSAFYDPRRMNPNVLLRRPT
jgi:hypothetical protein